MVVAQDAVFWHKMTKSGVVTTTPLFNYVDLHRITLQQNIVPSS